MKNKKVKKLKVKPNGKITLNFKVKKPEADEIKTIARKYTKGNVTALVRLSVKQFRPIKKELISIRPTTSK